MHSLRMVEAVKTWGCFLILERIPCFRTRRQQQQSLEASRRAMFMLKELSHPVVVSPLHFRVFSLDPSIVLFFVSRRAR